MASLPFFDQIIDLVTQFFVNQQSILFIFGIMLILFLIAIGLDFITACLFASLPFMLMAANSLPLFGGLSFIVILYGVVLALGIWRLMFR
jgi:hypothetical protein